MMLTVSCGSSTTEWRRIDPAIPAPEFTLPQLDGPRVLLSDYRGQVVIMEFWATWCGPCRFSTPSVDAIYRAYRSRGVTALLINEGESANQVRAWAKRRFVAPILLDEDGQVARQYGLVGIPRLFIVDQAGQIVYDHSGYGGGLEQNLKVILEEMLVEPVETAHAR